MADVKISALNALGTAPAAADLIPVVDVSGSETKKLRIDELFTNPNVTGTVTADGLTVAGTTGLKDFNILNDTGTTVEASWSHVDGSGTSTINVGRNSTWGGNLIIQTDTKNRANFASNGDISFYEDTGTTAKFFWDASAESLGIGTSSPDARLRVDNGINSLQARLSGSDGRGLAVSTFESAGTNDGGVIYNAGLFADSQHVWQCGGTERMRIDSSGNVGIGTSSPTQTLNVLAPDNNGIQIESAADEKGYLFFGDADANTVGRIGYDHATDHLDFWTNSSEAMRIDSSGNVGIGTTSPLAQLEVTEAGGGNTVARFSNTGASTSLIQFQDTGTSVRPRVGSVGDNLILDTNNTERARIDSSGNLLVGKSSVGSIADTVTGVTNYGIGLVRSVRDANIAGLFQRNTSDGAVVEFGKDGTTVGSISVTGSATAYNTSSDYRLKENVVSMDNASDRVLALNPVRFNFIADPDKTVDGFLAHEAQEVVPEAVHGVKDEVDDEGNPVYQGIDQSKLVPLLTKALQEALTEIADLKARVSALETN